MKIIKRKILPLLLIVLLLLSPVLQIRASAAAAAAASVVPFIVAMLAEWGISTSAVNSDTNMYQSFYDLKLTLWNDTVSSAVSSAISLANLSISGGKLLATAAMYNAVRNFASWLVSDSDINSDSEKQFETFSYNGFVVYDIADWLGHNPTAKDTWSVALITGGPCYFRMDRSGNFCWFSENATTLIEEHQKYQDQNKTYNLIYDSSYQLYMYSGKSSNPTWYKFPKYATVDIFNSVSTVVNDNVIISTEGINIPAENVSESQQLVIDFPGESTIDDVGTIIDNRVVAGEDVLTGEISIPDDPAIPDDPSIPDDPAIPEESPVINVDVTVDFPDSIRSIVEYPSLNNPSTYGIAGLSDVFPFCIPFDVALGIQLLVAEPEPWVIRIPLGLDVIGISEEIVIDFDDWSTWVQVFRTMELLAFVVGLAYVTRSMFIRS